MEEINTICVVCGQGTNAGVYPPVCGKPCRDEWDLETQFNAWAKEQARKDPKIERELEYGINEEKA